MNDKEFDTEYHDWLDSLHEPMDPGPPSQPLSLSTWERRVDQVVRQYASMSVLDIPGEALIASYCDGLSPRDAALIYLEDEGGTPSYG